MTRFNTQRRRQQNHPHDRDDDDSLLLLQQQLQPLTSNQLQRVNDVFVELYGYPFQHNNEDNTGISTDSIISHTIDSKNITNDDSCSITEQMNHDGGNVGDKDDDTTTTITITPHEQHASSVSSSAVEVATTTTTTTTTTNEQSSSDRTTAQQLRHNPVPDWLCIVMGGNRKYATRVWEQLSFEQQQQYMNITFMYSSNHYKSNIHKQHQQHQQQLNHPIIRKKRHNVKHTTTIKHQPHHDIHNNNSNNNNKAPALKDPTSSASEVTTTSNIQSIVSNDGTKKDSHTKTKANNIESLLQQLEDNKKVSTIAKTAMDWEQYKEQNNQLKETLEHHTTSNKAYLPKQDFLHRVNIRQYENEKQQRFKQQQLPK